MSRRFVALIIMDGWGYRQARDANAVALADPPFFGRLWREFPHTLIHASEERVGLPAGQMGNSEVGHLNLGAGRVVYQEIVRISKSIRDGDFFEKAAFVDAMDSARANGKALHLVGLLSDGGVHSLSTHLYALIRMAKARGLDKILVHVLLDGRDTPPTSGIHHVDNLRAEMQRLGAGEIATVMGRYYAMDRDNRWDRVERAYKAMVRGEGVPASDPSDAVCASYAAGKTDEFMEPAVIARDGRPVGAIAPGDSVIFFNFRADRAREITRALAIEPFDGFPRPERLGLSYACMTEYDATFGLPVAFPPQPMTHLLADVFAEYGVRNLRIAETEKYAHVTYFFNGGIEKEFPGETRAMIPSPRVATYDLKPEMSAREVGDRAVAEIASGAYDAMVLNFANGDMVGHTGILPAAMRAVAAVDANLQRVVEAVWARGGVALVTADHGNCETMVDAQTGEPMTAHTTNLVPFVYADPQAMGGRLSDDGALADVAPTMLAILRIPQPPEMTGQDLLARPRT
ncbi:MAG TPA: 2,3-bisphosphoglycerate-independent phosphoglycerate mutase [Candidatus Deferrimicrobiaceae bacterium]|jgi:2,3-bisphosphoglycerate-independent phosphoglycerate mutase